MKGLNVIFNIVWVIFVGLFTAIASFFTGLACCITIIGIPFGIQHFKFIKLAFAPAGKIVMLRFGRHPFMNTIWLLFGGLITMILYILLGVLFCITIIGIPVGRQLFKIAIFNAAPFGAEVIGDGEYTKDRDTFYDYDLLTKRIVANPDVVIGANAEGGANTVKSYFIANAEQLEKQENDVRKEEIKYRKMVPFFAVGIIVIIPLMVRLMSGLEGAGVIVGVGLMIAVLMGFYSFVRVCSSKWIEKPYLDYYNRNYKFLFDYYPNGSKIGNCKKIFTEVEPVEIELPTKADEKPKTKKYNLFKRPSKIIIESFDKTS